MILIGESGSTKTKWTLVSQSNIENLSTTIGLNPNFVPIELIEEAISKTRESISCCQTSRSD